MRAGSLWGLSLLLGCCSVGAVAAEEPAPSDAADAWVPASVELIPGFGYGGGKATSFAFGLIGGRASRVRGLSFGTALALVDDRLQGLQLTGAVGITGAVTGLQLTGAVGVTGALTGLQLTGAVGVAEDVTGIQIAGAASIARRVLGLQLAGALNVSREALWGLQVAGAANHAGGADPATAWQVAGGLNHAGALWGAQLAGGANIADQLAGAQLSVVNVGGDVAGAQVGVINVARSVKGLQLGVINLAQELDGVPIGVLSLVGNGQLHVQAWASDLIPANLSLKYGSRHVYTLVTLGRELVRPAGAERWALGVGMGGHVPLDRLYIEFDVSAFNVRQQLIAPSDDAVLAQARLVAGLELLPRLSVFAGVTANVLTDWGAQTWNAKPGIGPVAELGGAGARVALWPGLVGGVQL